MEKTRRSLTRQEVKRIYARVPVELAGWLDKQAGRQAVAMNVIIVEALEEYRERHRPGPKKVGA